MTKIGMRFRDNDNRIELEPTRGGEGGTIDLSRVLAAVRRQRWTVGIWVVIGILAGVAYLATTPKQFRAETSVLLAGKVNRTIEDVSTLDGGSVSENALESAQQVIRSRQIALLVTDALDLHNNESYLNTPSSGLSKLIGTGVGILRAPIVALRMLRAEPVETAEPAAAPPTERQIDEARRQAVARSLQQQVQVYRVGRSNVFVLGFASHDPAIAAAVVNAYADAYAADLLNANFETTARTTEWLQQRLTELQGQAETAAMAAERFRAENGLVASRGALMSEDNVSQLNSDLSTAITEAARARALVQTYTGLLELGPEALTENRAASYSLPGDTRLATMQEALSALVVRLRQIETDFGADHQQAVVLRQQIADQADVLYAAFQRAAEQARGELEIAEARETALRESLGQAVATNDEAGAAQIQLRALESRALTLSTLYETMLGRFQEIDQQKDFPISNVRILSQADVPQSPFAPRGSRVLILMMVVGGLFGVVHGIRREWRDRFVRTAEEVQNGLHQQFLGYLPRIDDTATGLVEEWGPASGAVRKTQKSGGSAVEQSAVAAARELRVGLHALAHPRSHFAEALRSVRLASDIAAGGTQHRVLGVTSIRPGEGKTRVALELAGVFAATGEQVLLIDLDPRNPGLSRRLGLTGRSGVTASVMGRADWGLNLHRIRGTQVDVLGCEAPKLATYSGEMLATPGLRALINEARSVYTTVIVDLAPLGPVVDARVVMPMIDQTLMVAEWGQTPRQLLRDTLSHEPALTDRLLGMVLNKVDMDALQRYVPVSGGESYFREYGQYLGGKT